MDFFNEIVRLDSHLALFHCFAIVALRKKFIVRVFNNGQVIEVCL